MSRRLAPVVLVVGTLLLVGCGADDSVNPSNPEAGPAKDASSEASKDAGDAATARDASKDRAAVTDGSADQ